MPTLRKVAVACVQIWVDDQGISDFVQTNSLYNYTELGIVCFISFCNNHIQLAFFTDLCRWKIEYAQTSTSNCFCLLGRFICRKALMASISQQNSNSLVACAFLYNPKPSALAEKLAYKLLHKLQRT